MKEKYPKVELYYVEGKDGKYYAMAFTSRESFKKCNDTSGLVMFIGDLFVLIEGMEEVNGIVLNIGREEIIFDKMLLRATLSLIDFSEDMNISL